MNNKVSVLLPVYNGERFIHKAIQSVLEQTFENFELLIYNDGSIDNTKEIIESIKDPRIKLFNYQTNKGIVNALNFLIDIAVGSLIARIDADDIWYPNKLEKQVEYLKKKSDCMLVGCFARLIDDNGNEFVTKFKQYSKWNEINKYLPNSNFIIHSSVLMKKNIFSIVGMYREKYLHTEDYDLWLRILKSGKLICIIPKVMLDYRVSIYSVNFRFRKTQSKNVIKLKINYWRQKGFKYYYTKELLKNLYYLLFPYWILNIKRKIQNILNGV